MSEIFLCGGAADATVLSNVFIDEYLKDANDAQLKVYLFLVRRLQAGDPVSISDMADRFNHTEKDILRALCYWEKCGVLTLKLSPDRTTLQQIRLLPLSKGKRQDAGQADFSTEQTTGHISRDVGRLADTTRGSDAERFGDAARNSEQGADATLPGAAAYDTSNTAAAPSGRTAAPQIRSITMLSHQSLDPADPYAKPAYSLDELKSFQQQENTAQLIFIAEQYLGRTLSPADMKSILFFTDKLHFSDDLIDYLLQYCVERGKKDFRYIEKVAIAWAEAGITTPAQAEGHISRYDKNVYSIMNALGKTNTPARNELAYIRRWTEEFCFELDVILEACGRTVLATDRHRFAYADSILAAWYKAGVHHVADIARLDSSYQKERASRPARSGSTAEYNSFMHSSYDFNALEEALLKQ